MARSQVYATTARLPDRFCQRCGALIPRLLPSGWPVPSADYSRRQYCSDACARAAVRRNDEGVFWARVDKNGPIWNGTPCWLWTGGIDAKGYGRFSYSHDTRHYGITAHRYAYLASGHVIPDDLTLDHLCRRRHCVNPAHLEPVPDEENRRRGAGSGGLLYTHCPAGHERSPDTLVLVGGVLRCRPCYEATYRRRYARQRQRRIDAGWSPDRHRPPKPCSNCGTLANPLRQGMCQPCYRYQQRHGEPRPHD